LHSAPGADDSDDFLIRAPSLRTGHKLPADEDVDFSVSSSGPNGEARGKAKEDFSVAAPRGRKKAAVQDDDFSVGEGEKDPSRPSDNLEEPDESDEPDLEEPESDENIPSRLGGYEVLTILGKGGMGSVLLGRQISLQRKVAIKVMHPEIAQNPNFVARFTREAYAAAQLTHHNVVQVYDIGEDKGQHFFSMEFVQGQSLMDMLRAEGRLAPEVAVGYILQAARGLRQGHKQGMVHRDIKPANLLVNDEGIVKVADLGLVKLPGAATDPEAGRAALAQEDMELTGVGLAVGTPAFMAPEQAVSSSTVDGRADIYSLGCTLYTLVTGRPPFEGKSAPEVMSKHLTDPIIPPETLVKRMPSALSAILMQMLAKEPDERYQTMDEVIAALEGFLGLSRSGQFKPSEHETDQLEKFTGEYHAKSTRGRKWWMTVGFIAVCVGGIVAAAALGRPFTAVKVFFLLCMTPPTYFVVHGILSGGVVFNRVRTLVFGMRPFDWLMIAGGTVLFLGTLYLFGMLIVWVKLAILAFLLSYFMWTLTDQSEIEARMAPLRSGRRLCRMLRKRGLSEEQLREFVCKYAGPYWEEFFEALFGYEAKIAARGLLTGQTTDPWVKHGTWREPVVAWADARLEARRRAREERYLQKVEAKALEAKGVSKAEAEERAAALAASLVDQAEAARAARKAGKEVDLRGMVKSARSGKPKSGYKGKRLRGAWLRGVFNDWLGRRLRFVIGAAVFAAGVLWMHQNNLLDRQNPLLEQVRTGQILPALNTLTESTSQPLTVRMLPLEVTSLVDSYRVAIIGFCLLASALFFYGWRSTLPALLGVVIAIAGPAIGVPDVGEVKSGLMCLGIGIGVMMGLGWLLRK